MKREILFRAKTANPNGLPNHESYWVYGLLGSSGIKDFPYLIGGCFVIPETTGQFTGLTDKDGVKIFEGDILSSESWCANSRCKRRSHIVKWGKAEWIASGYNGEIEVNPPITVRSDWGVIGNIHDNPELLK